MTFKVRYKEVLIHEFYIDADSKEDVPDEFYRQVNEGDIDFSDACVIDSGIDDITESEEN